MVKVTKPYTFKNSNPARQTTETPYESPCTYPTGSEESSTPACVKNKKRNSAWMNKEILVNGKKVFPNKDRHNGTRAINRAEQGENVSYATLKKYGVSDETIAAINEKRRALDPKPDPLIIKPTPLAIQEIGDFAGTAGIAAAAREQARLDAELRRAEEITQNAVRETRQAQDAMMNAVSTAEAARLRATDLGVLLEPNTDLANGLTFTEMRAYFIWVEQTRNQTPEQERLRIPTTKMKGEFVQWLGTTFSYSDNFFETNFKYPVAIVEEKNPAGPIWAAIGKVGCQDLNTDIIQCVLKRQPRTNKFMFVHELETRIKKAKKTASGVVGDARAMEWWISRYPGIYDVQTPGPGAAKQALGEQFKEFHKQLTAVMSSAAKQVQGNMRQKQDPSSAEFEGEQLQFQQIYDYVWANLDIWGSLQTAETTGRRSQVQLFFMMYKQVPIRDNMGFVRIVTEKPTEGSQKRGMPSLIYVPKTGESIFYLNQFKTISDSDYGGPRQFTIQPHVTKFINQTLKAPQGRPREYLFIKESIYEKSLKEDKKVTGADQTYSAGQVQESYDPDEPNKPGKDESSLSNALVKPVIESMIAEELTSDKPNKRGTNYLRKAVLNEAKMSYGGKKRNGQPTNPKPTPTATDQDEDLLATAQLHARSSADLLYQKLTKPYKRASLRDVEKADTTELSWQIAVKRERKREAGQASSSRGRA